MLLPLTLAPLLQKKQVMTIIHTDNTLTYRKVKEVEVGMCGSKHVTNPSGGSQNIKVRTPAYQEATRATEAKRRRWCKSIIESHRTWDEISNGPVALTTGSGARRNFAFADNPHSICGRLIWHSSRKTRGSNTEVPICEATENLAILAQATPTRNPAQDIVCRSASTPPPMSSRHRCPHDGYRRDLHR